MTHKERMLGAVRGEALDGLPWAPRLDLWYRARQKAGTLPAGYEDASLMQLTDDLGMGFHSIVPNFQDLRSGADDGDQHGLSPPIAARDWRV